MADGNPFPWGLTPGGTPEDAVPIRPVAPVSPVDQGHFVAVPDPHALPPTGASPANASPAYASPTNASPTNASPTNANPSWNPEPVNPAWSAAPAYPAEQPQQQQQPAAFDWQQPVTAEPISAQSAQPTPVEPNFELPAEADAYPEPAAPYTTPAYEPAASEPPAYQTPGFEHAAYTDPVATADAHPGTDPNPGDGSALDNLFGEAKFVEYEPGLDLSASPFQRSELVAVPTAPRGPMPPVQKRLIWVAAALVAVLALGGLFVVGKVVAPAFAAAPVAPAAPSIAPEIVGQVLGPVAPGTYGWDDLLGTECVEPWGSAWDQDFTVVDCGEPHSAQLVYRGTFSDSAIDPYPRVEVLQSRMNLLCASSKNIDYSAAKEFDDIQLSSSFAASESDWVAGQHDYFCFVSRSSGEQLTTNVAMPDRAAPVVVEPEP